MRAVREQPVDLDERRAENRGDDRGGADGANDLPASLNSRNVRKMPHEENAQKKGRSVLAETPTIHGSEQRNRNRHHPHNMPTSGLFDFTRAAPMLQPN